MEHHFVLGLATWRLRGESISLLTFLGFHIEPSTAEYKPSFSGEFKRKVCAIVYIFNIICASFTGRPLLMSHSYMTTRWPLDLGDLDLDMNQSLLEEKRRQLDVHGWNQDDSGISSTTFVRAWAMLAVIREEVFQIAFAKAQGSEVVNLLA